MINLAKTEIPNRNEEYYGLDMRDVAVSHFCKLWDEEHQRYEEAEKQRKQDMMERRRKLLHLA